MTDEPNQDKTPPAPPERTPPAPPELPPEPPTWDLTFSNVLDRLLKRPLSLLDRFEIASDRGSLAKQIILIAIVCLTIFGFVAGLFSGGQQLWAAPLKIVFGVLFSGLLCLPSLYIFTCLGGLDSKFTSVAGVLAAMLALLSLLLVGFAPVVWLFSASTESAGFIGGLCTLLWLVCAGFGIHLVQKSAKVLGLKNTSTLAIWSAIFILVTLQMPTTLRPILGTSDQFLNLEEKRFFLHYWGEQLSGRSSSYDEGQADAQR